MGRVFGAGKGGSGARDGVVFVPKVDGALYGLDFRSGAPPWTARINPVAQSTLKLVAFATG